jgi:hypothetical protein
MCTYYTEHVPLSASSGKGASGWFPLTGASVYFDHPVHAPAEHSVNIDFLNPALGPTARVAVELSPGAASALAQSILSLVALAEAGGFPRPSQPVQSSSAPPLQAANSSA